MQQRTLDDAERDWHIARLTRSLERWRTSGLDSILPDEYARYCATLAHLEAGGAYRVRDVTEELLKECARGICNTVLAGDQVTRTERAARAAKKKAGYAASR